MPIKYEGFYNDTTREINCSRGCKDSAEHNVLLLETKQDVNRGLAATLATFLAQHVANLTWADLVQTSVSLGNDIEAYLNFEINEELRSIEQPLKPAGEQGYLMPGIGGMYHAMAPITPQQPYGHTADLIKANEHLAQLEAQREKVTQALNNMPEDMATMMETAVAMSLNQQIESVRQQISFIQARLEEKGVVQL